jgi:hypothetical protein
MRKGFPANLEGLEIWRDWKFGETGNLERLEIEGFFGKGRAHTIEPSVFN